MCCFCFSLQLQNATTTEEFQQLLLLDEFNFRYDLGVALRVDSITIQDKEYVISALAKHFSVLEAKAELDQLLCGLSSTLSVLDLLRSDPILMRPLLVKTYATPIIADETFDAFHICYSPDGSNQKEREETTIIFWVHFLQNIECKQFLFFPLYRRCRSMINFCFLIIIDSHGMILCKGESFQLSLGDVMIFTTGLSNEPPLG